MTIREATRTVDLGLRSRQEGMPRTAAAALPLPVLPLLLCALFLTAALGLAAYRIEKTYLHNNPFFYDPVGYQFYNARLSVRVAEEGRLAAAAQDWLGNIRHPLRTVPLILFAPGLLADPVGHLATALPALLLFLVLLGGTVFRRTGHLPYALATQVLFCAIPALFSPHLGLGAYWLDLPAAFFIASAALCLLQSSGGRDLRWLAAFAVLAAAAILSRYMACVYVFVVCAPPLAGYLLARWRREGDFVRTVLRPFALIAVVIGALAGYFLIAHYPDNIRYYTEFGYAIGHGAGESARFVLRILKEFLGNALLLILTVLAMMNLAIFARARDRDWAALAISLWFAVSTPLLLIVFLRAVGSPHAVFYAVPLIFLAAVAPAPWDRSGRALAVRRWGNAVALPVLAAALLLGARAFRNHQASAAQPTPAARGEKQMYDTLVGALRRQGEGLVWGSYFDENDHILVLEALSRHRGLPRIGGPPAFGSQMSSFTRHAAYWRALYPGQSPRQVCGGVYAWSRKAVDIAVVYGDPARPGTLLDNPYSISVARYMAQRIPGDPNWSRVFAVKTQRYGTLVGYRNRARGRGVEAVKKDGLK